MERFERVFTLHQILSQSRRPVPIRKLAEELECQPRTVSRVIREMRNLLNAPIEYNRSLNGYCYAAPDGGPRFELPGLWFNSNEIYALLSMESLLQNLEPGFLARELSPIRERLKLVQKQMVGAQQLDLKRLRVLGIGQRQHQLGSFQRIAGALFARQQIQIDYHARSNDAHTSRTVSPQRLTHYRHNWYLDAWCHSKQALRVFSLERILSAEGLTDPAKEIDEQELDAQLAGAFGIFAGPAKHEAVLHFSPERARWVADEHWHPKQQLTRFQDGGCELRFPYSDDRELIQGILKHGHHVEVVAPASLRQRVVDEIARTSAVYLDS